MQDFPTAPDDTDSRHHAVAHRFFQSQWAAHNDNPLSDFRDDFGYGQISRVTPETINKKLNEVCGGILSYQGFEWVAHPVRHFHLCSGDTRNDMGAGDKMTLIIY
ncbi:MAG: hypothetical protein WB560_11580 [Desulfobaccales bacterium]